MRKKTILLGSIALLILSFTPIAHGQWVRVSNGLPQNQSILSLTAINTTLFAGTNFGGYKSDNFGLTWSLCTHFPADTHNVDGLSWDSTGGIKIFGDNMNLYAVGQGGSGVMFLSTDMGTSWDWDTLGFLIPDLGRPDVNAEFFDGSNSFLGTDLGILLSTRAGASWVLSNSGLPNGANVTAFAGIGSDLFAGLENLGLFRSTDHGASWVSTNYSKTKNGSAGVITVLDTLIAVGTSDGVSVSPDEGLNWTMSVEMPIVRRTVTALASNGSDLFAGTTDSGVYLSIDGGQSWSSAHDGLQSASIEVLAVCGGYVFAGTSQGVGTYQSDQGIWRRPLSDFTNAGVAQATSATFELSPNPTTGILTVHNPPTESHISVLNMLGQTVLEIANPGSADFSLDLSHLSPGPYCVRLFSPEASMTKMIVRE